MLESTVWLFSVRPHRVSVRSRSKVQGPRLCGAEAQAALGTAHIPDAARGHGIRFRVDHPDANPQHARWGAVGSLIDHEVRLERVRSALAVEEIIGVRVGRAREQVPARGRSVMVFHLEDEPARAVARSQTVHVLHRVQDRDRERGIFQREHQRFPFLRRVPTVLADSLYHALEIGATSAPFSFNMTQGVGAPGRLWSSSRGRAARPEGEGAPTASCATWPGQLTHNLDMSMSMSMGMSRFWTYPAPFHAREPVEQGGNRLSLLRCGLARFMQPSTVCSGTAPCSGPSCVGGRKRAQEKGKEAATMVRRASVMAVCLLMGLLLAGAVFAGGEAEGKGGSP